MKIKKWLAAAMATVMVMGTSMTAMAEGSGSAAAVPVTPDQSSSTEAAVETEEVLSAVEPAGAAISVAGTSVKTAVAGTYLAKTVQGIAVTGTADSVKQDLGLTAGQVPYVIVFDTDAKKSHLAMDCVNAAAQALGAKVEAILNIDLGVKSKGKYVRLENGSIGMVAGLPKGADTTKTVNVVCVRPGGIVTILEDNDTSPKTVTFEVQAGLGTYAIVTK